MRQGEMDVRRDEAGSAAVVSVRGEHRANEDAFAVLGESWVVCDGMGGHAGGELASATASTFAAVAASRLGLVDTVELASVAVAHFGEQVGLPGMGTTIVMAQVADDGDSLDIAWCGDSRAYLLVDGKLTRLTTDHNETAELVAAGEITEEEAWDHPGQSTLTSGLGFEYPPEEVGELTIELRGRLLLCSDGLTSGLRDRQIAPLLAEGTPAEAAERLATTARPRTHDDVTALVVDLEAIEIAPDGE